MQVNLYLNFQGISAQVIHFYQSVLGGEITEYQKFGQTPMADQFPTAVLDQTMHICLRLPSGTCLMASDLIEEFGHKVQVGNQISISLHPDSRAEADRIFAALSQGGVVEMAMQETFWGAYYGSFVDQYGIRFMINVVLNGAQA